MLACGMGISLTSRASIFLLSGLSRTVSYMIKMVLLMGLAWLLTGCVDVTSAAAGTDGRTIFTIECDGEARGCFDKAGELCPGGYYLIERKSGSNEVRYTAGLITTPYTRLAIECK